MTSLTGYRAPAGRACYCWAQAGSTKQDTRPALIGFPVPCFVFRVSALDTERTHVSQKGTSLHDEENRRMGGQRQGRSACSTSGERPVGPQSPPHGVAWRDIRMQRTPRASGMSRLRMARRLVAASCAWRAHLNRGHMLLGKRRWDETLQQVGFPGRAAMANDGAASRAMASSRSFLCDLSVRRP